MLTEYRVWLTVTASTSRRRAEWEDLLDVLAKSPASRGPAMSCDDPADHAGFTVSYPASDAGRAGSDSIAYVQQGVDALGWLGFNVRVDEVEEVDVEAELLE